MSILHYTIGLPPKRVGGSVLYAYDLMSEQSRQGYKVLGLICGDTLFHGRKAKIKYSGKSKGIEIYRLTNPLTPTLIYGTSDPASQIRSVKIDEKNIIDFIKANQIKVFHLHTLMGIHRDIIKIFKDNDVKIVYTTHDFHGICPRYSLLNEKGELCCKANGQDCAICNANEPSDFFLRLASSTLYQNIKGYIKKSSFKRWSNQIKTNSGALNNITTKHAEEYDRLLEYYRVYFSLFDIIHFNSSQTQNVFREFLPKIVGKVIPVITGGISDKRKVLSLHSPLSLCFIGSTGEYKGFTLLREVLMELGEETSHKFKLFVYGNEYEGKDPQCESIEFKGRYDYSELSAILYNMDCVIVPSKWYETFSLVTLEALAHGRPVIVSDHVGAKDIVARYDSKFIFSGKNELRRLLKEIMEDKTLLEDFNATIMSSNWEFNVSEHAKKILELYND